MFLIFSGPVAADENRPSKADISRAIRNIEEALEISKAEERAFKCGKKFVTFLSFDTRRVVTIAETRIVATEVQDLIVDGELVDRFFLVEDAPFREARMGGLRHGAAITMDNSSFRQLLMPPEDETDFSRLPYRNFREFLAKADVAYYGEHNMRWAHYSARDHERGRPYVVVGTRFFARLVQGLVGMANEQWMWDEQFAARWHERRRVIVRDVVRTNVQQSFTGKPDLPDLKSVEQMMGWFRSVRSSRREDYDSIHAKWKFNRAAQSSDTDGT